MHVAVTVSRKMENNACAACRIQRKRCSNECPLAPHFPSTDPQKFEIVQRVHGTSRVIKILQGIPSEKRGDAVKSMVYEATARLNDPVNGCAYEVQELQKRIQQLELQLAAMQNNLDSVRENYEKLVSRLSHGYNNDDLYVYSCMTLEENQQAFVSDEMDPLALWQNLFN